MNGSGQGGTDSESRSGDADVAVQVGGEWFSLRPVGMEDVDQLHRLDKLCFPQERAFSKGYFILLLLYHRAFGWALWQEETLAAFILLTTLGKSGNISTIDVHPRLRRRGIGSWLMNLAETALREMGMKSCTLQVAVSNTGAVGLYRKLGFRKASTLRRYYAGKEDGYFMEKSLVEEG